MILGCSSLCLSPFEDAAVFPLARLSRPLGLRYMLCNHVLLFPCTAALLGLVSVLSERALSSFRALPLRFELV